MENTNTAPQPETALHFLDYWRIIRIRKTVILAVFLLVAMTATVVTYILPESYASTVRINVQGDVSDINPIGDRPTLRTYDPYLLTTEFEIIQSQAVLPKVIENLKLSEKWAKKYNADGKLSAEETFILLKRHMDVHQSRNTSLIEIRVDSEDPQEAADIANEIALVYQKYRLNQRQKLAEGGIETLKKSLEAQRGRVKEVQAEADQLRKELKISDAMADGAGPSYTLEPDTLRRIKAYLLEAKYKHTEDVTILAGLTNLSPAELRQALPKAVPGGDAGLNELLSQLTFADQAMIKAKEEYGPESPELRKVTGAVADLNEKTDARVKGIINSLVVLEAASRAKIEKLSSQVDEAQADDIATAERSRPYFAKKRELETEEQFYRILSMKIAGESTDVKIPKSSMVEIVDEAKKGIRPVKPNKPLNIGLGIVVGLLVGVGLAFFIEYLDTSVKTIDEVERSLQAPVLGVIPQNVGIIMKEGAESPHAEAYRVLRTNLLFARKDEKLTSIVVVSGGAGEGKSTTVFNLATIFAQNGHRVVLVDSDLRRPTIHKILGVSNSAGLTNYLLKQKTLEEVIQTTTIPTLDFLPSGKLPSSSMGILNSKQMEDLIGQLKLRYDFVFFDSPPMMGLSDGAILASEMDLAIQVVQYRRYPQPMTIRAKQMIEKVGGNLIGIVLNNINMSQDENYYYYSGYYSDYYSKSEESAVAPNAAPGKKAQLEINQKY